MSDIIDFYIRDIEYHRQQTILQFFGPNIEYSWEIRDKILRMEDAAKAFRDYDNQLQLLYRMREREKWKK